MAKKKKSNKWTRKRLVALGVPAVVIPGILLAMTLGWNPSQLIRTKDYYSIQTIFPKDGVVFEVQDGDTFTLQNGVEVRMLGIDAPNRGEDTYEDARHELEEKISGSRVFLEYDRYQDDKYGRVLAWVWKGCTGDPEFLPANYMHLSGNTSKEGIQDNPRGCANGELINEYMVDTGFAQIELYKERGELKYQARLAQ